MGGLLRSRWVRGIALAAALVGLYAFLGFRVAPGIVRSQAIDYVKQQYGRDLRIGEVSVNPFLLQLEIHDLSLPDADGSPMLAFRRLFVDFEASSLWHRAYVFREVALEAPRLKAVIRPGGNVNLADLAPKETAPPEKAPASGGLPPVWLHSLAVSDGAIGFLDRNRAAPFERRFAPVNFTLKDFRTTAEGGGFQLSAQTPAGEGFAWQGRFEVAPAIGSQGDLSIHGLRAQGISEFLADALPFTLSSGQIDVAGHYDISLAQGLKAKVDLSKIEVTGLAVRARGSDSDWIEIPGITVTDTSLALPARTITIAGVTVADMQVQAWMAPDGSVNLKQLFAPGGAGPEADAGGLAPSVETTAAPASTNAETSPARLTTTGEPPPLQLTVGTAEVRNATINFEDRLKEPVKQFVVTPLNVRVSNASLDLARPVAVSLDAVVNGVAPFKAEGTVTPSPLAADLSVSLSGARMQILQPYVLPVADLTITDGRLTVDGRVKLDPPESPGPDLRFDGDVTIDDFASVDNALKQDLVNFKRLEVRKISYAMGPDSAIVEQVLVQQPFARVIISAERVVNISAVLDPEGTRKALEERRAAAAAEAAMTPAQKAEREREAEAAQERAEQERKAGRVPVETMAPLPAEGMPVRIREVRVSRGTLDFTDNNVQPNFSARIQDVQGTVTGLSSDPKSHAKLDFKGKVGDFSPVTITGEVQPFSFERYADIGLRFENISLPIFNPYSGRFAGYAIAKGSLTTDLHYLIQDRKLDAKHHIRIDQLEWGERTATQGEATLPVKFATVLLRDVDGVINLDIPVSGTLGDPTFRVGPIVWQIIKNLIVKAVTAPFRLLGALFAGAEEAQFVEFTPGSATLDPPTIERLGSLSKSLLQKPGLNLDVPIGALPDLDGPALRESAFQEQLGKAMKKELGKAAKESELPSYESLDPGQKIDVLNTLLEKQTGSKPKVPEPAAPPEGTSRKDAKAMEQAAEIEFLETTARANVTVPATAIGELSEARATAIQHALVDSSGLDPARVFLVRNGKVTAQDGKVRLQLELK